MRSSIKGRLAVTAMIDIALRDAWGPVPLNDIALRQQISLSYLEQLFSQMRHRGLVASTRGPGGGYSLGRKMESITVADIIQAVEGDISGTRQRVASCTQDTTNDLWSAMNAVVVQFAKSVTLKKLVSEQHALDPLVEKAPSQTHGVFKPPVHTLLRPGVPNSVFALGRNSHSQL